MPTGIGARPQGMPNRARATSRSLPEGLAGGCEGYGPNSAVRFTATACRLVSSEVYYAFERFLSYFAEGVYVSTLAQRHPTPIVVSELI